METESPGLEVQEDTAERKTEYYTVPADVIIANGNVVRPEGMDFIRFWKNRRNSNLALKARLRYGKTAKVMINMDTMSVVTMREKILRDKEAVIALEHIPEVPKVKRKKIPKNLRHARR